MADSRLTTPAGEPHAPPPGVYSSTQIVPISKYEMQVTTSKDGLGVRVPRPGLSRLGSMGAVRTPASPNVAQLRTSSLQSMEKAKKNAEDRDKRRIVTKDVEETPAGKHIGEMITEHVRSGSQTDSMGSPLPVVGAIPEVNDFRQGPGLPSSIRRKEQTFGSPLFRMVRDPIKRVDRTPVPRPSNPTPASADPPKPGEISVHTMPSHDGTVSEGDELVEEKVVIEDAPMTPTVDTAMLGEEGDEGSEAGGQVIVAHPVPAPINVQVIDTSTHPLVRLIGPEEAAREMLRAKEPVQSPYGTPTITEMLKRHAKVSDGPAGGYEDGPGLPSPIRGRSMMEDKE